MRKIKIRNKLNSTDQKTNEESSATIMHPMEKIMETALSRIKSMIDTSIVVGEKIETTDGQVIIPISKVSVGFVAGGGEYNQNQDTTPFAGGSGAGFSVSPIGFAVFSKGKINLTKIEPNENLEKLIESIPEVAKIIAQKLSNPKQENNPK